MSGIWKDCKSYFIKLFCEVFSVIVVLREFKGKKWVVKFVKSVEVIVVNGDKDVSIKVNGKELKC